MSQRCETYVLSKPAASARVDPSLAYAAGSDLVVDRRKFLAAIARGMAAAGTVAVSVTLLARRTAPCGADTLCTNCALLTECRLQTVLPWDGSQSSPTPQSESRRS